jgi:hypothetical protein
MVVDQNKKGFAGISSLVTDFGKTDSEPTFTFEINSNHQKSSENENFTFESPTNKSSAPNAEKNSTLTQNKSFTFEQPPKSQTRTLPKKDNNIHFGSWIFAIACFSLIIWYLWNDNQSSYDSNKSESLPSRSSSPPSVQKPSSLLNSDFEFKIPPIGSNNLLSLSEIRWCVREDIRIEAMRNIIVTNDGIQSFNKLVDNYNLRCSKYRYINNNQFKAELDVEPYRKMIISEAILTAKLFDGSSKALTSVPNTREAQQILLDLGYQPGPIDGIYGSRTADAVKAFQRDIGIKQDGNISPEFLELLRIFQKKLSQP